MMQVRFLLGIPKRHTFSFRKRYVFFMLSNFMLSKASGVELVKVRMLKESTFIFAVHFTKGKNSP